MSLWRRVEAIVSSSRAAPANGLLVVDRRALGCVVRVEIPSASVGFIFSLAIDVEVHDVVRFRGLLACYIWRPAVTSTANDDE